MGMVLFVLARVAKLSVERTTIAILPWLIPLLGSLVIITYMRRQCSGCPRCSAERRAEVRCAHHQPTTPDAPVGWRKTRGRQQRP